MTGNGECGMARISSSANGRTDLVYATMQRKRILFVHNLNSSFVRKDIELLRKHFEVQIMEFGVGPRELGKSIIALFLMIFGVVRADLTYSWFGGRHSLWAVLLSKWMRKKSVVVVGGFEVARIPEIGYGAALSVKSTIGMRWILANASRVLTVDESLEREAVMNLGASTSNIVTIPTGYDSNKFKARGRKEDLVLTVGYVRKTQSPRRKGLDVFVKTAEHLKELSFVHVHGDSSGDLRTLKMMAGPNVKFVGKVTDVELLRYYQRAKVYCQLSLHEGLPSSLCEAMLCECVPVGTRRGGIPTAIGDTGFYVPYGDPHKTAEAIRRAIMSSRGKEARKRIKLLFSLEARERRVVELIHELVG
jgi:glycosyltransferase involved in cell wall biosynthesis